MSTKDFPSDLADKFVVRMPEGLRERIKGVADAQGRSMNSQVVVALQAYLADLDREAWETGAEAQQAGEAAQDVPIVPGQPFRFSGPSLVDLARQVDQLARALAQQGESLARIEARLGDQP